MAVQINYMLKVKDAKLGAVKKALSAAGIDVVSVVEVYKQDLDPPEPNESESAGSTP